MGKNIKRAAAATVIALLCISAAGCGCGKKEKDPASEQVLKITITPEPTPTPAPEEMNPDAVVTNGNITMVNGYLAEKGTGSENQSGEETPETDSGKNGSGAQEDEGGE